MRTPYRAASAHDVKRFDLATGDSLFAGLRESAPFTSEALTRTLREVLDR